MEEMLRFDSPAPAVSRVAAEDMEIRGARIRAGERVFLMLNAANRDPEAFADPERFDIARRQGRQIAFGFGIHFCVGAPLARLEAALAFPRLLAAMRESKSRPTGSTGRDGVSLRRHGLHAHPLPHERAAIRRKGAAVRCLRARWRGPMLRPFLSTRYGQAFGGRQARRSGTHMSKIKVATPVVELDGDEMTRIIWAFIKEKSDIAVAGCGVEEYYDLGIERARSRPRTGSRVEAPPNAIKRYGVGVKCATITPDEARVEEFGSQEPCGCSPNGTIRNIIGGTVSSASRLFARMFRD